MKANDFKIILEKHYRKGVSGRKLFLWYGSVDKLKIILPSDLIKEIDLLNLSESNTIIDDDTITRSLKNDLSQLLNSYLSGLKEDNQILVVYNCWVLSRYKIPLSVFYQDYLCDKTMAILQIDNIDFDGSLPDYIKFNKEKTLQYISNLLPEENKQNIIVKN